MWRRRIVAPRLACTVMRAADHVLAHVDQPARHVPVRVGCLRAACLGQFDGAAHGLTARGDDPARLILACLDREPPPVVEARRAPGFRRASPPAKRSRASHDSPMRRSFSVMGPPEVFQPSSVARAIRAVRVGHNQEGAQLWGGRRSSGGCRPRRGRSTSRHPRWPRRRSGRAAGGRSRRTCTRLPYSVQPGRNTSSPIRCPLR